jgi:hypothetical protein
VVQGRDLSPLSPATQVDEALRTKLRDWTACVENFEEVPSDELSWEFAVGNQYRLADRLQIRAAKTRQDVLSFAVFVTNWVASQRSAQTAVAGLILLLNSRLNWTRLCVREGAIEAEVAIPVQAMSMPLWQLALVALRKSSELRETLRVTQVPAVAEEVLRHLGFAGYSEHPVKEDSHACQWDNQRLR